MPVSGRTLDWVAMRRTSLLVALLMLMTGCSLGSAPGEPGGFVSADGQTDFAADDRQPAPSISGLTLDGAPLSLADLSGPVVINFWGSWCGPCVAEAPHLAAVAEQYAAEGVSVVGVNVRDTTVNARSFEREYGITYPSWYDESAQIASQLGALGPTGLPSTILLDREHRVASRLFGAVTARQLAPRLDALLSEPSA